MVSQGADDVAVQVHAAAVVRVNVLFTADAETVAVAGETVNVQEPA